MNNSNFVITLFFTAIIGSFFIWRVLVAIYRKRLRELIIHIRDHYPELNRELGRPQLTIEKSHGEIIAFTKQDQLQKLDFELQIKVDRFKTILKLRNFIQFFSKILSSS